MTITVKNTRAALIVPQSVRRRAGIKAGDLLEFQVSGRVITILPKRPSAPKAGNDEYTPEQRRIIDARLAKADDDIKHGRLYGPFDTAEQFIASLHKEARKLRAKETKRKSK